jgi:hypothetical protein
MTIRLAVLVLVFAAFHPLPVVARTPTNDAAAFRTFDLYSDRAGAVGTLDHLNFSSSYPSYLISPAYMVIHTVGGVPDTVALLHLQTNDVTGMEVNGGTPTSYAEYAVVPPILGTSISVSVNADVVFAGLGQYYDFLKPMATITATYEDASTWMDTLSVGQHIRTWLSGSITCLGDLWYTLNGLPFDQYAVPLYASGGVFMDMQEVRLPHVPKKIALIRVQAIALDHFCSIYNPHLYAGYHLHAVSLWPNFDVVNASSQPVVRKSQFTNQPHGGYLFGGTVVGTRRATNATACQVASMAMCYEYAGFPCTVDGLNAHLQQNKGYEPSNVAIVTWVSPTGDAIRYRAYTQDDTRLRTDDLFLVERGYYSNPLATFRVTTPGEAVLVQTHNPTTPVVRDDVGRVYWSMKRRVADTFTHDPSLVSVDLGSSPQLPDEVEALLTQNIPVQLNLVTHGHMVVADGWVPSFRPGGTARGTYSIKDPYDDRNFTRLIESGVINGRLSDYGNQFRLARYVVPPGGPQPLAMDSSSVASNGTASLSILTNGTWRVELIDPPGRRMLRDAGSGEDVAEIPGAWIMDVGSEHDNGADWDGSQTGYSVDVAQALDGDYLLRLYAEAGHAANVSSYDEAGVISSDAVGDTAVVPTGSAYNVHYSAASGTVAVTLLGPLGVRAPPVQTSRSRLAVRGNPATGPVEFIIRGDLAAGDVIEVFDTSGRRVDVVRVAPGTQAASWHWSRVGCRPGVYLARLRSGSGAVRFVVVR